MLAGFIDNRNDLVIQGVKMNGFPEALPHGLW